MNVPEMENEELRDALEQVKEHQCEFLNGNGSCALAKPVHKPNLIKIDTRSGKYELNGQELHEILSLFISKENSDETKVTITLIADVEAIIDDCSQQLSDLLQPKT